MKHIYNPAVDNAVF